MGGGRGDPLAERHPEQRDLIEAYHQRWSEMLAGAIDGTVAILQELRRSDVRLFALSNWSAETFPIARQRFPFLAWFDGIVISGDVGAAKPDAQDLRAPRHHVWDRTRRRGLHRRHREQRRGG